MDFLLGSLATNIILAIRNENVMAAKNKIDWEATSRTYQKEQERLWIESSQMQDYFRTNNEVSEDDIIFYITHTFWWCLEDNEFAKLAELARRHFSGKKLKKTDVKLLRDKWVKYKNKLHPEIKKT